MADKKSDVFNKPTAVSTADAAKKEADRAETKQQTATEARAEAAEERRADAAHVQHNKNVEAHRAADTKAKMEVVEFTTDKHTYLRTYPSGNVPSGTWGMAVWTRDRQPEEHPAFLDNQGDWWWATTTNQNGVNPAVEKTEEPIGWRMF